MGRLERERDRLRRERLRRRHLKAAALCGGLLLAILVITWIVHAVSGASTPKDNSDSNPESSLMISVNTGSPESEPSSEPSPSALPATAEPVQLSDPLLVLVNSETPLPEDWQVTLVTIAGEEQVDDRVYDELAALLNAAAESDVTLWVASAYRSVELQQDILDRGIQRRINEEGMTEEQAREDALRTINRPGYSEHHTGLAVDFNDVSDDFEETEAYYWLSEHAAEYGFVQRYKQSKVKITGIDNESWHYRYVGKEHAEEMERLDMCLEEYVDYLKKERQ